MRLFWVFLAGGLGSVTRYGVVTAAAARLGTAFPYGTLAVNVVGCFLIAVVMEAALRWSAFPDDLRLALTTGFLGGLTTYSSFAHEALRMADEGRWRAALGYFGATTAACFVAAALGLLAARRALGA